jgi:hypothetical protein
VDKNSNLKNGVRVQMDEFNLVVIKESTKEIAGRKAKSTLEKEENTTISVVLGVGMSSPVVGRHCRTSQSMRK